MRTNLTNVSHLNAPIWCFNGHVHTIAQSVFKNPAKPPHKRLQIPTPDDDFLELDVIDAQNDKPVIVLFHGLEGSTDRYYIVELMHTLSRLNWSVVAVNFRSCGSRMNRRKRFYHSGETGDPATVFTWIRQKFPNSLMGAVGFSLGGNVLLKLLGEREEMHPLDVAVAISVPYDLAKGSRNLNRGFNRVYERLFLQSLTAKLNKKRRNFPNLPVFHGSTLYELDDQITGPIHGFKGAADYYGHCSSQRFILDIKTRALLIHSGEDPICAAAQMPLPEIRNNPFLDYIITEHGGHVGFWSRPAGWLNKVIVNYIREKMD